MIKRVFVGAAAAFGVVPGLAIIARGLPALPGTNLLFGGVVEALGAGVLMWLWIERVRLNKLAKRKLTRQVGMSFIFSFASLLAYMTLYDWCVVSNPAYGTLVFPLWATGDLSVAIKKAGGRWLALDRYGYYPLYVAIERSSSIIWALTIGLLLILYQGIFSLLTLGLGLLAVRQESRSFMASGARERRAK
jgi:hypothetical protein